MSRVIDRQAPCERWAIPDLDAPFDATAGRTAAGGGDRQGYDEGFESGRLEGLASGKQEVMAQVQLLQQLIGSLAHPFDELDEEVEQGLVELTLAIVRKLVHVEIKSSPDMITAVVRETLALLPVAERDIRLHLHPEDLHLLEASMPSAAAENSWKTVADDSLQRGGCVVKTRASRIDASVEARLDNVIASFLNVELSEEPVT